MKSILQDWVMGLGLRQQGVLLGAIRGCDTMGKEDPSKAFVRVLRGFLLNPHCGDARKARSFIANPDLFEADRLFAAFVRDMDHYPLHYVTHLMHAIQIVGCYHPNKDIASWYLNFYNTMCHKLHVNPETIVQLEGRLNADEETFAKLQQV